MSEPSEYSKKLAEAIEDAIQLNLCPECDGVGHLGKCADGRLQSCESCGGHEDRLGCGTQPMRAEFESIIAEHESAAIAELVEELKRAEEYHYDRCDFGILDKHPSFNEWHRIHTLLAKYNRKDATHG